MQNSVIIELKAPFFSYREFNTGGYQYTLPVIPHSSAYGLALNLAGIEMKSDVPKKYSGSYVFYPAINTPKLEVAVGLISCGGFGALTHQYHRFVVTYRSTKENPRPSPKGNTNTTLVAKEYGGRKFDIGIIQREYLSDFHGVIAVRGNQNLVEKIIEGTNICYGGIPYSGQRNLFFSEINCVNNVSAYWFSAKKQNITKAVNLTSSIDRADTTKTKRKIWYIMDEMLITPPDSSWESPYHEGE